MNIKNADYINLQEPENSSIMYVAPSFPLQFPCDEDHQNGYLKDARRILDNESKEMNVMGLERLVAALIIELRGNGYKGKHN